MGLCLKFLTLILLATSANAFGFLGFGGYSWKEEALLHDGSTIIVTRTVERGGRHEIGQESSISSQSLTFTIPGTKEPVVWEDNSSKDIGGANFLPMELEIYKGVPYLIVHPMGTLSYKKWGAPNPPYVIFKFQGNTWTRISLQELPPEFKTPNLIFSSPDREAKKSGERIVSAATIKKLYGSYRQPEFKSILRVPVDRWISKPQNTGPKAPVLIKPSPNG